MADIQVKEKSGRRKVQSPKVDLTPMVDLGFILITFFIYTTTMAKPKSLVLDKPYDPPPPGVVTKFIDTSTITIIPIGKNKLKYYGGVFSKEKMTVTDYKGIREAIITKQKQLERLPNTFSKEAHYLHVIIKPANTSTYEDMVKMLDEMLINDVAYHAMAAITPEEEEASK